MSLFVAEPPAAYRVNRPAVVDSSVLATFIYLEPKAAEVEAALRPYFCMPRPSCPWKWQTSP